MCGGQSGLLTYLLIRIPFHIMHGDYLALLFGQLSYQPHHLLTGMFLCHSILQTVHVVNCMDSNHISGFYPLLPCLIEI